MAEHPGYAASKQQLRNRVRRIEGQVRGVTRMVDEERYCIDVLAQITAVQRALDRVALELVSDHTRECVVGATGDKQEERTDELLTAIDRLVSRR